ncbi:MAG TPA: PAS domain-containing protein [Terriglobales bacterium]|nr:PAS domain-containing protein [Terriglobales bacterium]
MDGPAAGPNISFVSPHVAAIHDYWLNLRGAREAPGRQEIDPADMPRLSLPYVLIVDLLYQPFRARYRLVGTHCVSIYGSDYTGLFLDQLVIPESVRVQIHEDYLRVATSRRSVVSIYNWQRLTGDEAIAEYAIMPIVSDGIVSQCLVAEHISYKGAVFPIAGLVDEPDGLME